MGLPRPPGSPIALPQGPSYVFGVVIVAGSVNFIGGLLR
jgi:hypothetical protein